VPVRAPLSGEECDPTDRGCRSEDGWSGQIEQRGSGQRAEHRADAPGGRGEANVPATQLGGGEVGEGIAEPDGDTDLAEGLDQDRSGEACGAVAHGAERGANPSHGVSLKSSRSKREPRDRGGRPHRAGTR
jgi:hypothetical protein